VVCAPSEQSFQNHSTDLIYFYSFCKDVSSVRIGTVITVQMKKTWQPTDKRI
jgi:hypothetical protein